MRARELLGPLAAWPWRRAPVAAADALEREVVEAKGAPSFQSEAYKTALDKLLEIAFEAGAREERARIAAIAKLPKAERFPRLALNLAVSGSLSGEQAAAALAEAELDLRAELRPPEPPPAESDGRVLH